MRVVTEPVAENVDDVVTAFAVKEFLQSLGAGIVLGILEGMTDPLDAIAGELDDPNKYWKDYGLNPDGSPIQP